MSLEFEFTFDPPLERLGQLRPLEQLGSYVSANGVFLLLVIIVDHVVHPAAVPEGLPGQAGPAAAPRGQVGLAGLGPVAPAVVPAVVSVLLAVVAGAEDGGGGDVLENGNCFQHNFLWMHIGNYYACHFLPGVRIKICKKKFAGEDSN